MFDSYNYTFNSLGSIGSIILLGYITIPSIEKPTIFALHFFSLLGIVFINYQYVNNFINTRILDINGLETKNIKIMVDNKPLFDKK